MRTVLYALMKCLYTIIYIDLHCFMRHVHTHILRKEGVATYVSDDPMKLSIDHEAKKNFQLILACHCSDLFLILKLMIDCCGVLAL